MNSAELPRLALIVVAAAAFIFIIQSYNKSGNNNAKVQAVEPVNNETESMEGFYADGEQTENAPNLEAENENEVGGAENLSEESDSDGEDPSASEGSGDENASFKTVEAPQNNAANNNNAPENNNAGNRLPNECYPKDVLTPQDLLPQDANSTWAQTVPNGQGSLGDQNFLNAGFHVGINTVGQSLRNANLQLRSEPPNPQLKVSPWLQTTIGPDVNRRPMEIGEV